jgi:hypothetical protein
MGLPSGTFYNAVGVGVATISTEPDSEKGQPAVSLIFPKDVPVYPDDLNHEDNFEDVFLSVAAAKTLLIDLRDAVEAAVSGKAFE